MPERHCLSMRHKLHLCVNGLYDVLSLQALLEGGDCDKGGANQGNSSVTVNTTIHTTIFLFSFYSEGYILLIIFLFFYFHSDNCTGFEITVCRGRESSSFPSPHSELEKVQFYYAITDDYVLY